MAEPIYRALTRAELDTLVEWAAAEGWNPGLRDADAFWAADPEAFVGIDLNGELIGGGAIVAYGREAGFMGLFIVKAGFRGAGLGRKFWYYRRDRLRARLNPDAPIAMDGVFAMQPFYAEGGFVFTHRNLRMEGIGQAGPVAPNLVPLTDLPFAQVAAYDRKHFLADRPAFLEKWIRPEGGKALAVLRNGEIAACGVVRPCRRGFKIGPLFADDPALAETLFVALSSQLVGQPLFLDTPENNPQALALAARHGMKECFGCARMVLGPIPKIPWDSIYGVTTFELG
jgi:GNAT superfamily N-acetyltransferase